MPAFQPYRGKPAVRNDREGRGNVGIMRSPVRASTLPDCGGREVTRVPTAILDPKPTCGAQDLEHSVDVRLSADLDEERPADPFQLGWRLAAGSGADRRQNRMSSSNPA